MKRVLTTAALGLALASPAYAAPIQWAGNGHYYEYISELTDWNGAVAAAAASTYLGQSGYLATVTSAEEQAFIFGSVTTSTGWLGGNDRETEGTWKWLTGPEAGNIFYIVGGPVVGYSNWGGGEPNDCCGGEDDLTFAYFPGTDLWNDIGLPAHTGPPFGVFGRIVEYNGIAAVPEPATILLVGGGLLAAARRRFSRKR